MADILRQRSTKTRAGVGDFAGPAPRLWERLLNYLFYIVAALAIGDPAEDAEAREPSESPDETEEDGKNHAKY